MDKKKTPPVQTGAMIESAPRQGYMIVPTHESDPLNYPTTIDTSNDAGKARLLAVMGMPDITVDPAKPLTLEVEGYLVYPDQREDEQTGELRQFIRTILLLRDGTTFGTTSEVVLQKLRMMVRLWPNTPWIPPLVCHVVARIGPKNKRIFHDVRVEPRS